MKLLLGSDGSRDADCSSDPELTGSVLSTADWSWRGNGLYFRGKVSDSFYHSVSQHTHTHTHTHTCAHVMKTWTPINAICVRAAEAVDTKPQHTPWCTKDILANLSHTHTHTHTHTEEVSVICQHHFSWISKSDHAATFHLFIFFSHYNFSPTRIIDDSTLTVHLSELFNVLLWFVVASFLTNTGH